MVGGLTSRSASNHGVGPKHVPGPRSLFTEFEKGIFLYKIEVLPLVVVAGVVL